MKIAVYVRKNWVEEISQSANDDNVSQPTNEQFSEADPTYHSSSRSRSGSAEDISSDGGEDDSLYVAYDEEDQKEIISKSEDDHDFLQLVNEQYNEADLVEWEPAPPSTSKPEEPGKLGAQRFCSGNEKCDFDRIYFGKQVLQSSSQTIGNRRPKIDSKKTNLMWLPVK